MRLGVILPQLEIGTDPSVVREYARTAEDLGFSHLHAYDHVLGADPDRPGGWDGPYDYRDQFHEVMVLFGHLAAVTEDVRLVTGVLVLPQRQTALVAKQAAEIDVLSGGRMTLGVGVGWNAVEYEALGEDFGRRGARIEEQVDLLRQLWATDVVDYDGAFHRVSDAGINPRPPDGSIPIWMGGGADVVLDRAARLADGWIVPGNWRLPGASLDAFDDVSERLAAFLDDAGRDPTAFDVVGRMSLRGDDPGAWVDRARAWADHGATHLAIDTMGMGLAPDEHVETVRRFGEAVGAADPDW